jgi:hypothetical protein
MLSTERKCIKWSMLLVKQVGKIQVIAFQSQDGQRRDVQPYRVQGGSSTNLVGTEASRAAPIAPASSSDDAEITGALTSGKVSS